MTIPSDWQLPQSLRERLGTEAGPQRMMWEEGHLLLILHAVPAPGSPPREGVLFWRSPDEVWHASVGNGIEGLKEHFSKFERELTRLAQEEASAASAREYHQVLTRLAPINRTVRHADETVQKARQTVMEDERLSDIRDRSAALERSAELLLQDANYGLTFTAGGGGGSGASAEYQGSGVSAVVLPNRFV